MNKKIIGVIAGAVILLFVLFVLVAFWIAGHKNKQDPVSSDAPTTAVTQTETTASAAVTETSAAPLYIIGEWNGKLAVFNGSDTSSPDKVYDVYISTLPEGEQQRLKNGIFVYDEQALQSLLEDYTS